MQTINTKWLWGIGALLLVNLVLLVTVFLQKGSDTRPEPSPFLEEALGFNPQQTQEFHALRNEHHQQMMEKNKEIKKLKDQFFDGLKGDVSKTETEMINKRIGELVAEIDMITYEHFQEVRALCTPEQQKEFDLIITDLLHGGMSQQGPPRMGPPEGNRGPGPPPKRPGGRPF
ncbi:Spy/CpxP family protein refolding chaperone [Jiulongibacter sediminis]|uniref:Spy/CpxP family protein refolding chaperone n=1 Tax=Jiulongibacter sediminis TaxID=1605367 RepID=UPI0026E97D25|nr:Spy/CpxP family protein refolding chaperone [Jiulongibacter sediminis]